MSKKHLDANIASFTEEAYDTDNFTEYIDDESILSDNDPIKKYVLNTIKSDNEDHNYTDLQFVRTENMDNTRNKNSKSSFIYSKVANSGKEKFIGLKITNLNDLKKATPRLKLPALLSSQVVKKTPAVPEEVKQKLHKYCRTCAGQKVPLVDIFSEKGIQMRLSQQIQHLEDINEHDSLSTQMCMDCICDMKMSYKFFMQIKKAEMKLKSISNTLNDSVSKSPQIANESKETNDTNSFSTVDDSKSPSIDNDFTVNDVKYESGDYIYTEMNDLSDFNESIEEFDPLVDESVTKKTEHETIINEILQDSKNVAYKYDDLLKAYVKIESSHNDEIEDTEKLNVENNSKSESTEAERINHPRKPNILKRNISSDENDEISIRKEYRNLSIDLKDLKIPKLNLHDKSNIKKEENGVMYVTAKGSKPNEMLLIKVKKMDKSSDNKEEKGHGKKRKSPGYHKTSKDKYNQKDIDEQIEQYKKKRVEVLGETANIDFEDEIPEIRTKVSKDDDLNKETVKQQEEVDGNKVENKVSQEPEETEPLSPESKSRLEKLKQRWQDIKKRHDVINRDLAEDCSDRLRAILKQKDEYIQDFVSYLKQRRIVVSRLRDEDIISLYEAKNNVVLEKPLIVSEPVEETDPFEIKEVYPCDFCDHSFSTRDKEYEHAKIHDFKLMHYCDDCKQEFSTHKAKRAHNASCAQKVMCRYCDVVLESKGKKRQHEQKHCDETNGQLCELCGEKFKHQGTLDQHIKSRHTQLEKIFKCPQCSKKFALRTKLTFHLKTVHTTSRPYLCEDCGSDFKNPASLRHHRIRKHQLVNNKKECSVCHKMIPVYSMSKHMHTHKAYTIECPHCDKMFKNTSTLKQHLRIHEDQRQYKCDMCGVGFNRRDGLRLHLKVHQKTDSRGLKECSCQICGEKFPNHSMLVIHRNRTHKDGRNYTCFICNRSMISSRSLEWHLSHIHNETMPGVKDDSSIDAETKRVSCYHCDKTFKTEMILRTHVKNTHVEKEPMKCLDCDLCFTSEVRLKHHMMVTHNRLEGTLACPHCPKRFVNQLRLKTHMISHSDERPHTCDLCGFMLKTKIQLIKHKQNRHSNERPLQCRYCSWRCKQVSALVCHERTHTNERPYSCSVCKQKFKYLGDKNKHERRHEILGGSGFKRIVTGRNTNKVPRTKEGDSTEIDSEQEQDELTEETKEDEEFEERMDDEMESFDESQIIKFETAEIVGEDTDPNYERMYVEDTSQDTDDTTTEVVMGMEETIYTEEVTTDHIGTEIIATDIIDQQLLQPGTVVHLQREDETGKIQMIPVMLSLPDLTDATSEVGLATTSIMYNN